MRKRYFPYGDNPETNPKWIRDRDELFRQHGNGWWVGSNQKPKPNPRGRPRTQGYRWKKRRGYGDMNFFVGTGFLPREGDEE